MKSFLTLAAAFVLLAALYAAYEHSKPRVMRDDTPVSRFARQFQAFEFYTDSNIRPLADIALFDMQDHKYSLQERKGRWLLINFWATWCAPCVKEIPTLQALQREFSGKPFDVVFVSLDYPQNGAELGQRMEKFRIPAVNTYYAADEAVWDVYNINALPTSLVVRPDGGVVYKVLGDADWSSKEVTDFIKSLL